MDVTADDTQTYRAVLYRAVRDAEAGKLMLATADGEHLQVFAPVFLGEDFIEFRRAAEDPIRNVIAFDKIVRISF